MNPEKEKRTIGILLSMSFVLMFMALLTITSTFAKPVEKENLKDWNVQLSEPVIKKGNSTKVKVNHDRLDFEIGLKEFGERFEFITNIKNDGDFDAYLSNIKMTNLKDIVIGKSNKTGTTYYLSDYVSYKVNYLENNRDNNIRVNAPLKRGDKLKSKTMNKILVTVKYKDKESLSEDELYVLKNNVLQETINNKEYLPLNINLYLNTVFQELK